MRAPATIAPLDPALTRVVVGDVHGDWPLLNALLEQIGVTDARGRRQDGFFVVQLGDLCHLGHDCFVADAATVEIARRAIDVVLAGNHELFHVFGLDTGRFAGMHAHPLPEVTQALAQLRADDQLRAAWCVDDWLLTHAGVHSHWADGLPEDPYAAATIIQERFCAHAAERGRRRDGLFDAVGPVRGFQQVPGGIFWADEVELVADAANTPWKQIVGHTPRPRGHEAALTRDGQLWICDAGAALSGRLVALVKHGADGEWTPVVVERPAGEGRPH